MLPGVLTSNEKRAKGSHPSIGFSLITSRQLSVCCRGTDIVWRTLCPNPVPSWTITPLHTILLLQCTLISSHLWLLRFPLSRLRHTFGNVSPLLACYARVMVSIRGTRGTNPHLHLAGIRTLEFGILSELLLWNYSPPTHSSLPTSSTFGNVAPCLAYYTCITVVSMMGIRGINPHLHLAVTGALDVSILSELLGRVHIIIGD